MIDKELQKRLLSSIILIPISIFFIFQGSIYFIFFLTLLFLATSYEWLNLSKKNELLRILGILFLFLSFFVAYHLRENTFKFFILIIVVCIFTDIGGYIFGKVFRVPKLTKISPNKTISGSLGSLLVTYLFIALIFFYFTNNYNKNILYISTLNYLIRKYRGCCNS